MHYLYRTYTGKEQSVARYLADRGYDVFLPLLDGKPLFPSYMFVNEHNTDFYVLNRAPGAIGILCLGDTPNRVPDGLVEPYKQTEWQRSEDCAEGSEVVVNSGAFNHIKAVVKAKKHDRIIVLMNILNQPQELEFALSEVEAA